jgi:UDP-2-acetamido-3-amino-2,3-dideoxy-glucuronate N-acetyltransferase
VANDIFVHETAVIDDGAVIGRGTRVWHFCHVMDGAQVGEDCVLGQNVFVAEGAVVGDRVRIQNNVSVYRGCVIEDDVFLGPSCVLTNVSNPRAEVDRKREFEPTVVRKGATIGANATLVCGVTVGRYAMVGAGAVVTRDVEEHHLVVGVPARPRAFVCRCGERLPGPGPSPSEAAANRAEADPSGQDAAPRGGEPLRCARCGRTFAREGRRLAKASVSTKADS